MGHVSRQKIAATIYGKLSAHSINLYKDIDRGKRGDLYQSYLEMAIQISNQGYYDAYDLLENGYISEDDNIFEISVNNKVFYLASRANEEDKQDALAPLKILERIATKKEEFKKDGWWNYTETVEWATLNFHYKTKYEVQLAIQSLLDNPRLPRYWKVETHQRYEKYEDSNGKGVNLILTLENEFS